MTQNNRAAIRTRLETEYGEMALWALETSCVVQEDYDKGYDHVLMMIHPALEEEMLAQDMRDGVYD